MVKSSDESQNSFVSPIFVYFWRDALRECIPIRGHEYMVQLSHATADS